MATWQFDFHLIPATSVERHLGVMPESISSDHYNRVDWWQTFDQGWAFEDYLGTLLPPASSWRPDLKIWGDDDGNRFDVSLKQERIVEVFGRLDVRGLSHSYLTDVVELARRFDLVFVTEANELLGPSVEVLLSAVQRSPSFAFVSDPTVFLKSLRDKQTD